MNLNEIPLFRMMSQKMEWLSERQRLLSHNVANANTPGYKSQDLKPLDFASLVRSSAGRNGRQTTRATQAGHFSGSAGVSNKFKLKADSQKSAESMTGNNIVLEEEMMKVAQTSMEYQLTTNLYRKHLAIIRAALNPPR
ncbi:MAG: flagellar basal body rod protein FlgB [Rhodospirillaceae bacterium]|nr:flagellar basal body rod protein FlgB [Rhodospirillaceae bacterium]MBT3627265.1 flagellar basal body rod protein FlgB [Rhodospirillaceae bacterium]MBT5674852.1 flagellar basal body rod protein FlgB [Rhodospirillaceae bacterium]MBT6830065.1 flagellar basal body rod protein FlgB [Rhodospirillaceae bacterium]